MAARDLDVIRLSVELSELMLPGLGLPAPLQRLVTRGGGATFVPYFFTARGGDDLFICIRGAAEPADFLLVLDFEREAFAGGKARRGCLRAARWIIGQCRQFIDQCRGRVICCGHSLGGASAGMVAAVLTLEEGRRDVIGVCQAPFPILSADLARRLEPHATTFVYRNDVVPRLSSANMGAIVRMFVPPGPSQAARIAVIQGVLQQMIQSIMGMNPFAAYNAHSAQALQARLPDTTQRLVRAAQAPVVDEFFLPGKAYLLGINQQDGAAWVRDYTAADAGFNAVMLLSAVMDHNGEYYKDAIYGLDTLE
jgi:pimeloyl-ACP methyl ester carboxylesterase